MVEKNHYRDECWIWWFILKEGDRDWLLSLMTLNLKGWVHWSYHHLDILHTLLKAEYVFYTIRFLKEIFRHWISCWSLGFFLFWGAFFGSIRYVTTFAAYIQPHHLTYLVIKTSWNFIYRSSAKFWAIFIMVSHLQNLSKEWDIAWSVNPLHMTRTLTQKWIQYWTIPLNKECKSFDVTHVII